MVLEDVLRRLLRPNFPPTGLGPPARLAQGGGRGGGGDHRGAEPRRKRVDLLGAEPGRVAHEGGALLPPPPAEQRDEAARRCAVPTCHGRGARRPEAQWPQMNDAL